MELVMKQKKRWKENKKEDRRLLCSCCMAVFLAGILLLPVAQKNRQTALAADLMDQLLIKAPDQAVTDFAIRASTVDSVTLSWTKASDAETYYISYWESGKPGTSADREDIGNVSECKITNLKQSKYIFQIQPANKLRTGIPLKGAITKAEGAPDAAMPAAVKKNHVKAGYCSLMISGLSDFYHSEAEIYDASGNLLESSEGDAAGVVIEDDGIKKNGFYAVRVRGFYDQTGGYRSYGDWTEKYYLATPFQAAKLSQKNKKVIAKWAEVQGAESYTISISKSASGGFIKAAETGKTSAAISKYNGANLKAGKTYYLKVTAKMTAENETYTVSSTVVKIKIR